MAQLGGSSPGFLMRCQSSCQSGLRLLSGCTAAGRRTDRKAHMSPGPFSKGG